MAKVLFNGPLTKEHDWGNVNGNPASGRAVQDYIQKELANRFGLLKYLESDGKYHLFTDEDGYEAWRRGENVLHYYFDAPKPASIRFVTGMTSPITNVNILGQSGNTFYFNYYIYNNSSEQLMVEPVSIRITITRDGELVRTITTTSRITNGEDALNPEVGTNFTFSLDEYFTVEGSYTVSVLLTSTISGATASQTFLYDIVNLQLSILGTPTTVLPYDTSYFDITYTLIGGSDAVKRIEIYVDGEPLYQNKLSGATNRMDSGFEAGASGIITIFTRKGNDATSDFVTWPALGESYGVPKYKLENGEIVEVPGTGVFTNEKLAGQPVFKPGVKHSIQFRAWIPRDNKLSALDAYRIYSKTNYAEMAIADDSGTEQVYVVYTSDLEPGQLFNVSDTIKLSLQQYNKASDVLFKFTPISTNSGNNIDIDWNLNDNTILSAQYSSGNVEDFKYSFNDPGEFTLNAVNDENIKLSVEISVSEFETNGKKIEESQARVLKYKWTAENRSNSERDGKYKIWSNTSITADLYPDTKNIIFNNFPEVFTERCGWDGTGLILSDGATIKLPVDIFSQYNPDLGLTFEIDFETLSTLDDESVIMDYSKEGESTFIKLTVTEASTWAKTMPSSDPLKTNYKDGTRNKIAFTFNPTTNLDDAQHAALQNPNLIFIYINGVLDRAARWGNGTKGSDDVRWATPSDGVIIGDPTGKTSLKIYSIRIYPAAISPEEEFMNFLTDSGSNKMEIFNRNNIYNTSNEISFELVKSMIPTLLLSMNYTAINNENTAGKKNNYQYELQYFDPNDEQKYLGFYVRNGWMSPQGTSSMAYPTKNLRPYFNKIKNSKTVTKQGVITQLSDGDGDITSIGVSTEPSYATEFWPYEMYGSENENNVSSWVDGDIQVTYADANSGKKFNVKFNEEGPQIPYATNGKEMYQKAYKKDKDFAGKVFVNVTSGEELSVGKNKDGDTVLLNSKGKEVKLEKRYFHEIGADRPHDVAMALAQVYENKRHVQLFVATTEPALNDDGEMVGEFEPTTYSDSHSGKYYMDAYHTFVKPEFEVDTDKYDLYLKQLRYSGVKIFERISVTDDEGNFIQYIYTKAKKLDRKKEYYGLGAYWRQYDGYGDTNNSGWTDRWTLKADFAESSMTHNAGVGRLWGNAMKNVIVGGAAVCKTDAQDNVEKYTSNTGYGKNGFDVRTSCDGKPIVLFVKQEQEFDIASGKAGYAPIQYGGIFNVMTDKSSTKLFGFETIKDENNEVVFSAYSEEDGTDPHKNTWNRVQCYEFLQNGSSVATGLSLKFDDRETDVTEGKKIGDGRPIFVDFESRFPDSGQERHEDNPYFPDDVYGVETNDFESFWRWVNFTKDAVNYKVVTGNQEMNGYTLSAYSPITWEEAQAKYQATKDTETPFRLFLKYVTLGNEFYVENGGGDGYEKDTWTNPLTGKEEVPNLDLESPDPGYVDAYYEFIENIDYSNVKKTVNNNPISSYGYTHVYKGKVKGFDSHFRVDHSADDAEEQEAKFGVWAYLKLSNGKLYYTNEYGEENQPYDAEWTGEQVGIDDYETINVGTETNPKIVDAATVSFMDYFSITKYQHLAVYKVAAYYIYITRFAAADQVIKNSMMTTENGEQWYYINYDNDTVLGVRNDAVLAFNWDVNRDTFDYSKNNYAFAGARSVLWNNLEMDDDFMEIVKTVDRAMFAQELLSKQTVLEYFNEKQEGAWCERLYNKQEDVKYLSTFKNDFSQIRYLVFLQGNRESHRTWFINKRWDLYDSLWESGLYDKQYIQFKQNILDARETNPGIVCTFTSSSKYRYKAIKNNQIMRDGNVELGINETFNLLTKTELAEGDPVYLRGAQKMNVLSFRNGPEQLVELILVEQFEYSTSEGTRRSDWVQESGTTMLKLLIGNGTKDAAFKTFSGYDKILSIEDFDIRRCINISPSITTLSNLHRFRASGSGLTSFAPHKGAVLYEVSLPSSIGELTLDSVNFEYQSPDNYKVYQPNEVDGIKIINDALPYEEDAEGNFTSGPYSEEVSRKYTSESKSIFDYTPNNRLNSIYFNSVKGFDTLKFIQDWLEVVANPSGKTTLLGVDWTITVSDFIDIYRKLGKPELGTRFSGNIHIINDEGESVVSYEDYKALVDEFTSKIFDSSSSIKFLADEVSMFISSDFEEHKVVRSDVDYNSHFVEGCIYYDVVVGETIKFNSTIFPEASGYKLIPSIYENSSQSSATRLYSASTPREYSSRYADITWSGNTMSLTVNETYSLGSNHPIILLNIYSMNQDNTISRPVTDPNNPATSRSVFIRIVEKTYPTIADMQLSVSPTLESTTVNGKDIVTTSYEEKTIELKYNTKTAKIKSFTVSAANIDTNLSILNINSEIVSDDKKGISFKINPAQNSSTKVYNLNVNIIFDSAIVVTPTVIPVNITCKTIPISKLLFYNEDGITPLDSTNFEYGTSGTRIYTIVPVSVNEEIPNIPIVSKVIEGEPDVYTDIKIDSETNKLSIKINPRFASVESYTSDRTYQLVFEDQFGNSINKEFTIHLNIQYLQDIIIKRMDYLNVVNYTDDSNYCASYTRDVDLTIANGQGTFDRENIDLNGNNTIGDSTHPYLEFVVLGQGKNEDTFISEETNITVGTVTFSEDNLEEGMIRIEYADLNDERNHITGINNRIRLYIDSTKTIGKQDKYQMIIPVTWSTDKDQDGDIDTTTTEIRVNIAHSYASAVSYKKLNEDTVYLLDSSNGFYEICSTDEYDFDNDIVSQTIAKLKLNRVDIIGIGEVVNNGSGLIPVFASIKDEYSNNDFFGTNANDYRLYTIGNMPSTTTVNDYNGYEITKQLLTAWEQLPDNSKFNTVVKSSNAKLYIPSYAEFTSLTGKSGTKNTNIYDKILTILQTYSFETKVFGLTQQADYSQNRYSSNAKYYFGDNYNTSTQYYTSTIPAQASGSNAAPRFVSAFYDIKAASNLIGFDRVSNGTVSVRLIQGTIGGYSDYNTPVRLFVHVS